MLVPHKYSRQQDSMKKDFFPRRGWNGRSHPRGVCAFGRQASLVPGPHASANFVATCASAFFFSTTTTTTTTATATTYPVLRQGSSTSCHSSREWRQKHSSHQGAITQERSFRHSCFRPPQSGAGGCSRVGGCSRSARIVG